MIFKLAGVYCAIILILILKLIHIRINPSYYDRIRGYERYEKSGFFWPKGLTYRKTDPPGFALPTFVLLYLFVIEGWMIFTHLLLALETNQWCITFYIAHPFFNILYVIYPFVLATVFMSYFTICSPFPWDICVTLHRMHYTRRANLHRKWTAIFLITLILGGILHVSILNKAGYLTENELIYFTCFPEERQVFRYEDCFLEREFQEEPHYKLVNNDGDAFDLSSNKIHFPIYQFEEELWEYVQDLKNDFEGN